MSSPSPPSPVTRSTTTGAAVEVEVVLTDMSSSPVAITATNRSLSPETIVHETDAVTEPELAWATSLTNHAVFSPTKDWVTLASTNTNSHSHSSHNNNSSSHNNNSTNNTTSGSSLAQHGGALWHATRNSDRRWQRQCLTLIVQASQSYDDFSQALLKAGQSLKEIPRAHVVQQSLVFWSGSTSKLAHLWRTEVTQPWQVFQPLYLNSVHGIRDKYWTARRKCLLVRQAALRAEAAYNQAIQETERAVRHTDDSEDNHDNNDDDSSNNNHHNNSLSDRLAAQLKDYQQKRDVYQRFVQWQHDSVQQCNRLEQMGLEALQLLERDSCYLALTALRAGQQAQRQTAEEVLQSVRRDADKSDTHNNNDDDDDDDGKKETSLFARLRRAGSAFRYDEGSGMAEVQALGLPDEIGLLRDQIRTRLVARAAKVQSFRLLVHFVEYICTGLDALSRNLTATTQKYEHHNHNHNHNHSPNAEGPQLLASIVASLEVEAKEAKRAASELRELSSTHLSRIVTHGDKHLKAASDIEEQIYRQMCEAARTQSKAMEAYLQTTEQQNKVHERASMEDGPSNGNGNGSSSSNNNTTSSSNTKGANMNKHVSRQLANMFSVLPNGGEQALKMFNPAARASIMQGSLQDADEKESKSRQILDVANQTTNRLCRKYQDNAQKLSTQFDKEDQEGWGNTSVVFNRLRSLIITSRESILQASRGATATEQRPRTVAAICVETLNERVRYYQSQVPEWSAEPTAAASPPLVAKVHESQVLSQILERLPPPAATELVVEDDVELAEEESQASPAGGRDNTSFFGVDAGLFGMPSRESSNAHEDESAPSASTTNGGSGGTSTSSPSADDGTKWMGLSLPGNGMTGTLNFLKKQKRRYRCVASTASDRDMYLSYFIGDNLANNKVHSNTAVTDSFSCTFHEGRLPVDYTRAFVTDAGLVLANWYGKKKNIGLNQSMSVETVSNPWNGRQDSISLLASKKLTGKERITVFGGLVDRRTTFANLQTAVENAKANNNSKKSSSEGTPKAASSSSKSASPSSKLSPAATTEALQSRPPVPPDAVLAKMEVILDKKLQNVTIDRFYEAVWKANMYQDWLEVGCMDVSVGAWEMNDCTGSWDGESYGQSRPVKFRVKRKTHLYIGPPIANVNQVQRCQVESPDKCVMSMTIDFEGIPYSDCFTVEVRWVARRVGASDLQVQVGLFVNFRKNTFLKSQIRSGTTEETRTVHEDLFAYVKKACATQSGGVTPDTPDTPASESESVDNAPKDQTVGSAPEEKSIEAPSKTLGLSTFHMAAIACVLLLLLRPFVFRAAPVVVPKVEDLSVTHRLDRLETQVAHMQTTLDEILLLLRQQQQQQQQ